MKNIVNTARNYKTIIYKMIIFTILAIFGNAGLPAFLISEGITLCFLIGINNKSIRKKIIFFLLTVILFIPLFMVCVERAYIYFYMLPAYIVLFFAPSGKFFKNDIKYLMVVFLTILGMEWLNSSILSISYYIFAHEPGIFHTNSLGVMMNFIVVAAVMSILGDILNNRKLGMYITTGFMTILAIINFFVQQWTNQSVTFSDLFKAQTAATVLGQQQITGSMIIKLVIGLFIYGLAFFTIHKTKKVKLSPIIVRFFRNILLVIVMCFSIWFCSSTFLNFNGGATYGVITNLIITGENSFKKPDIMVDYSEYIKEDSEEGKKPNVIIIMSESFCDVNSSIEGLQISENYMPYFESLCEKYPSGTAYSSVCGNNTVTSEFECLTATSSLFSTEGSDYWRKYVSEDTWSLVKDFNDKGYSTYGIHPSYDFNYSRGSAYKYLGFDKTCFIEEMEEKGVNKYRDLVTDESNFSQIIEMYEENKKTGNPFFCYNITIQNHAAYKEDLSEYGFEQITTNYDDYESGKELSNYLTLMKESDDALKKLINYFDKQEEETIILFFGDHQPMFVRTLVSEITGTNALSLGYEESAQFYAVPYLIWSNKGLNYEAPEETSINYLASILYEAGGLQKPAIINYNLELMKKYPVVTANFVKNSNGILTSGGSINNTFKTAINENDELYPLKVYQCWTYDLLKKSK